MRIAINASILGEEPTGTNIYTEQVLQHLTRLPVLSEHTLEVFTPRELALPDSIVQHRLPKDVGRSAQGLGNAWRRFLWNQTEFTRTAYFYDRVYCPTYNTSLALRNQVITIHDLLALRFPSQHQAQNLYCRFALPSILKRARKIIAVSQTTKEELLQNYSLAETQVRVVHNGCEKSLYIPASMDTIERDASLMAKHGLARYALVVGATFPHKNLEVLLNAIGMLLARFAILPGLDSPPLKIAIVGGENRYFKEIRQLVEGLGLKERVSFLGYIPDEDLRALYRNAWMLLYPSRFEGFGLPILEAMASGCPVLCSNIAAFLEVGGDAAIFIDPDDVEDWAESIFQVATRPEVRREFVRKGLEQVQKFSWQKSAEEIAQVLLET